METSFIYIITDGQKNYKVGVAQEPQKRLKQLQTGHPERLEIAALFQVPASEVYQLEKEAHQQLKCRYVKRGEWFKDANGWDIEVIVDSICEQFR